MSWLELFDLIAQAYCIWRTIHQCDENCMDASATSMALIQGWLTQPFNLNGLVRQECLLSPFGYF